MKKLASVFIIVFNVFFLTSCGSSTENAMLKKDLNALQDAYSILSYSNDKLNADYDDMVTQRDDLESQLRDVQAQLDDFEGSSSYSDLQEENKRLKDELASKDSTIASLQESNKTIQQIYPVDINQAQLFYSLMFSPDPEGKKYEDKTPTWYSNPYCMEQDKVKSHIVLVCKTIINWKLPNGTSIYTCRTVDNVLVYSIEKPTLTEVK